MEKTKKYEGRIYKRTLTLDKSITKDDYGKCYIGQTDNMTVRDSSWYNASNNSYGGKKITEARNKYGVGSEVWKTEVLEKVYADTEEELKMKLDDRETANIYKYDSVNNGFNGSYGNGMQGVRHTDEAREKISKNHRKTQTEETKAKISKTNTGRKVSAETKQKISQGNSGKKRTTAQKQAQSDRKKGIEPVAASEGLRDYIKRNGHGPTLGIKQTEEAKANMKAAQQKRGTKVIAHFPDGTVIPYSTMLDAAKACNMNVGSIASVIKTGGTCRNGMRFEKML